MSAQLINLSADPALATIRKYKAAVAAFNAYQGADADEENKKLERAFHAAEDEFYAAVPTTPEGLRTKIAVFLDVCCDPAEAAGLKGFFDTLYKSVCIIAGKPGAAAPF